MSLDLDQQALDLIDAWEAGSYLHPAQKKAALQVAIRDALTQARAEGLRQAAEVAGKSLTEFHHRVGERYYAGYIADMRNHVTAAIRALAEGGE